MAKPRLNVMLVPEGGGEIRQFRVPVWLSSWLAAAGIVLLVFFLGAGIAYVRLLQTEQENEQLYRENEVLREELVGIGSEVDRLGGSVQANVRLANEARLVAGLAPFSEDVALLGTGGTSISGTGEPRRGISPAVERTAGLYRERLEQLSDELAFQEENLVQVKALIESNKERLSRVPTINPLSGRLYTSSGFGARVDPFTGGHGFHSGIDLPAPRGTVFRAAADGTVIFSGEEGGWGRTVKIDHGNGYTTVYAHASELLVQKGAEVHRGDAIGRVGGTGRTTGIHLHYEVRKDGRPINPRNYVLTAGIL